jgi:hypothetical protein
MGLGNGEGERLRGDGLKHRCAGHDGEGEMVEWLRRSGWRMVLRQCAGSTAARRGTRGRGLVRVDMIR